jgi:hypothetical protein
MTTMDMKIDCVFLEEMRHFLEERGELTKLAPGAENRQKGIKNDFPIHVRSMVYALLSNHGKWAQIEKHEADIETVFYGFADIPRIKRTPPEHFVAELIKIKCGNISIKKQMENLLANIETLEKIENEHKQHGGLDAYEASKSAEKIIREFASSSSPFKLKYMGRALVCEYLKNVGVQSEKPDVHVMRFLSRRGLLGKPEDSQWTDSDKEMAHEIVKCLSEFSGKSLIDIDRIIWSFCADGQAAICTKTPKCDQCPVQVQAGCKYPHRQGCLCL